MFDLVLNNIRRHVSLTEAEAAAFTSRLQVRKIRKRQYLLQSGDVCRFDSFVNSGCLRAFATDEKDHEHVMQFALEDWWIGDQESFLFGTPSNYHIEALENCELLQIDLESLEDLYRSVPAIERYFRIIFQRAFISLQQRIVANLSNSAEYNYRQFIERYPSIEQRVPQYQVASYLGITPEFLSKIRNLSRAEK